MFSKYWEQSHNQPEKLIARMNNYATSPSTFPFLTSIPEKIPLEVLQAFDVIHEVHPSTKAVPVDQYIG